MKSWRQYLATALLSVFLFGLPCGAKEYRIDAQEQFDALRAATFLPGDIVWFKRGRRFSGMFAPSGSGTQQAPIRIDGYGQGNRPKIDAGGKNPAGLFLLNPAWFCGIMKRRNRNVVIRYNISQNDRKAIYFYGFERNREAQNIHVYNNTHFIRQGLDASVFPEDRTPVNSRFENNIFYFEGRGAWGKNAEGINTLFRNNLYSHIPVHNSETRPVVADPQFVQPGLAGTDIDLKTMKSLLGYRLKPVSPCIDAGLPIPVPDKIKDMFGTGVRMDSASISAVEGRDSYR